MWLLAGMQIVWAAIFCGGTWSFLSLGALGLVLARLLAYFVLTLITWSIASEGLKTVPPADLAERSGGLGDLAGACEQLPK
jgi:hypothetical protein